MRIDKTQNHLEKIDEIYAFVSSDKFGEGLIGQTMNLPGIGKTFMVFVAADKARLKDLKPLAQILAVEANKKIKLIRLSVREELEEFNP